MKAWKVGGVLQKPKNMTVRGDEGSLPLIQFLDANIVVSPSNVKLGEIGRVLHVVYKFRDEG